MIVGISGLTIERGIFGFWSRRGNAGAGKDEAAKRLIQEHGFVPLAFADPMKRIIKEVYAFSDDQLWGPSEMRNQPDQRYPQHMSHGPAIVDVVDGKTVPHCLTPRFALQTLGEEWGRNCYRNTWAEYALRIAKLIEAGGWDYDQKTGLTRRDGAPSRNVVITDLRYKNEAEAVQLGDGYLVRCKRVVPKLKVVPNHKSEVDLLSVHDDDFNWILNNDGTVQDLWNKVDEMVRVWLARGK